MSIKSYPSHSLESLIEGPHPEKFYKRLYYRKNAELTAEDICQSLNLWVAISFAEIKEALAILQRAEFITCRHVANRTDGGVYWYVIRKGGAEAVRLSCGTPSIFDRPFAAS